MSVVVAIMLTDTSSSGRRFHKPSQTTRSLSRLSPSLLVHLMTPGMSSQRSHGQKELSHHESALLFINSLQEQVAASNSQNTTSHDRQASGSEAWISRLNSPRTDTKGTI